MLTPFHTVHLVHAVEAPLTAPTPTFTTTATRDSDSTFAYVGGQLSVHGASTAKVDLLATWTDQVDTDQGPVLSQYSAHVLEDGTPSDIPPAGTVPPATYTNNQITFQAPPPPTNQSGRTYLARHEFGDTKARTVIYQAVATSRFSEYFPSTIAKELISITGPTATVQVPSSARPPAPSVRSTLPTFIWSRNPQDAGGNRVDTRTSGVRVYLNRPWFLSGPDEKLAVVLAQTYPPPESATPYLSLWGQDPAFLSGLQTPSFARADATVTNLAIDELTNAQVTIAAYIPSGACTTATSSSTGQHRPQGSQRPTARSSGLPLRATNRTHCLAWSSRRWCWPMLYSSRRYAPSRSVPNLRPPTNSICSSTAPTA
jgi:hypothetical protein